MIRSCRRSYATRTRNSPGSSFTNSRTRSPTRKTTACSTSPLRYWSRKSASSAGSRRRTTRRSPRNSRRASAIAKASASWWSGRAAGSRRCTPAMRATKPSAQERRPPSRRCAPSTPPSRSSGAAPRGYDGWFAQGPTNASLAAVALYSRKVPEFRALLAEEGGNLPRFYARVKELARMPKEERDRVLAAAGAAAQPSKAARDSPSVTPCLGGRIPLYSQVPCLTRSRRGGRRRQLHAGIHADLTIAQPTSTRSKSACVTTKSYLSSIPIRASRCPR